MPIGRSREEQELNRRLVESLVKPEVIEPMNRLGWSHGTPPPPVAAGQPTPTEGAPAKETAPQGTEQKGGQPTPTPDKPAQPTSEAKADAPSVDIVAELESLRDANGLIAGKYKTVPDALKGLGHLANMAKQAFKERDELVAKLAAPIAPTPASPQPAAIPAAAPVTVPEELTASRAALAQAKARLDAVLSSVEDDGDVVDAETLRKVGDAQREVAELSADVRVQEKLHQRNAAEEADRSQWSAVDEYMKTNHPEALNHADEIGLHISADPVLQAAVAALVREGDKIKASVLAWQSYERSIADGTASKVLADAQEKEADLEAKKQVRQELLEKARQDAGVIQGSAGQGVHRNENAGASSLEEQAALIQRMRMEGDGPGMPAAQRFRRSLLRLDPAVFGPQD